MRSTLLLWLFFFTFLLLPFPLWGNIDYSNLDPDSPEVQQACGDAIKRLGPDRGTVAIQKNVIGVKKNVVDIIGIPKGTSGSGIAIIGQVTEVEMALKDLEAKVSETEIKIDLPSDILFDFDKCNIRHDAQEALKKVAIVIKSYPRKTVLIEGHTDSEGSDEYNMKLSFKRAVSVKQWLVDIEKLIDTNFQINGWGESKPIASNDTARGRQKNRRVEIIIRK
ncbi:MAG: OmpA family protein [Deltaproteobacteria bacterium]|jgi:outer membrane protein OmpA-like peptidoglycan-associated protein|nr:OmpA family protein [Deltaproteobacteria bacterium]